MLDWLLRPGIIKTRTEAASLIGTRFTITEQ
jgi:hypothetical protein